MEEWELTQTRSNLVLFVLQPRKFKFWSVVSRNAKFSPIYMETIVN